jgi:hypothetical protein
MLVVLHRHLPLHYASGKPTKQAMFFQLSHEYVRLKSVQLPFNVVLEICLEQPSNHVGSLLTNIAASIKDDPANYSTTWG